MKFDEAIRSVINRYAQFTGRASRSEYWYWVLFLVLASAAIGIASSVVSAVGYLSWLFNLATIVPSIAVAVRRLHDVGKSGWWLLASLVPVDDGLLLRTETALCRIGSVAPGAGR